MWDSQIWYQALTSVSVLWIKMAALDTVVISIQLSNQSHLHSDVSGGEGEGDNKHVVHLFLCNGWVTREVIHHISPRFCSFLSRLWVSMSSDHRVCHNPVLSAAPGQDLKSLHCYLQDGCCHSYLFAQLWATFILLHGVIQLPRGRKWLGLNLSFI